MNPEEMAVWSMALGAIGAVAAARLADAGMRPNRAQVEGLAYHGTVFLLVLFLSGMAGELWPQLGGLRLHIAQVLAGPLCVGLANLWIRRWLQAVQRDRVMSCVLRASSVMLPLGGLACLALPTSQQMPAAAALSLTGCAMTLWMTVRAWLMGDRLAPVMSAGCALTLPAVAGMHAIAMNFSLSLGVHALLALCAALSNALTGVVLWRRDRHERRTREGLSPSLIDPVTKLPSGMGLVQQLLKAQRRRRRTGRDGAVLAIMVFDSERIASQASAAGLNEAFICMAARIQRHVGVVNPVGRYYDRCFVAVVETIHSPAWLRTLGLRVASSLRRPMIIGGASGYRIEFNADIGVGVVHLTGGRQPIEDILHDAQRMAEAARGMRSRAAILDPATGEVVPVEQANLGPRRHRHMQIIPRVG